MPVKAKPWLLEARSYPPPPLQRARIRLDLNESPFPPPLGVVEAAARAVAEANRYPRRELYEEVLSLLASYTGAREDMLVLGLGGDMVLEKAFSLVLGPGDTAAAPSPSFSMYPVYASHQGARLEEVQLREQGDHWTLPWEELLEATRRGARLVAVDNPNNPTGSLVVPGEQELVELLEEAGKRGALVVLDEAYYEFSGVTYAQLAEAYDNLLVVRTLSKAFSLAGLRIGYGIAHPGLAERLRALMPPFLPSPSLAAAAAALRSPGYAEELVRLIRREREWLRERLNRLGARAYRSHTNFVLARLPAEIDPVEALRARGILVRRPRLPGGGWIRVTVGAPRENTELVNAVAELLAGPAAPRA